MITYEVGAFIIPLVNQEIGAQRGETEVTELIHNAVRTVNCGAHTLYRSSDQPLR